MTRASTFAEYSLAHALAREGAKPGRKEAHARLDAGAMVQVRRLSGDGWYVEDDGPGRLDGKMAAFGNGKLAPPGRVLVTDLSGVLESRLHQRITEEVLREAGIEERLAATLRRIALPAAEDLRSELGPALVDQPDVSWRAALERTAARLLTAQATP